MFKLKSPLTHCIGYMHNNESWKSERTRKESDEGLSPLEKKKKKKKKGGRIRKTTKGKGRNFRSTKEGAGMTEKGVREYRRKNPGSKLKTAVTEKNPSKKRAARRRSFCARSKGWKSKRGKAARRRWRC
jgi:hypothetical protein|tara:strand:+ start:736 stop:1122 length:387 start_codon:yes stop_codon:yes gene_type:complete